MANSNHCDELAPSSGWDRVDLEVWPGVYRRNDSVGQASLNVAANSRPRHGYRYVLFLLVGLHANKDQAAIGIRKGGDTVTQVLGKVYLIVDPGSLRWSLVLGIGQSEELPDVLSCDGGELVSEQVGRRIALLACHTRVCL